jgi:transposase InsO family protein
VESFFGMLKRAYRTSPDRTRAEATQEILEHIEVFYNRQRRHSALG